MAYIKRTLEKKILASGQKVPDTLTAEIAYVNGKVTR